MTKALAKSTGGGNMAILTTFITSIVEMLILAGVSYGGIRLGKVLRDRKDAKMQAEIQPEKQI